MKHRANLYRIEAIQYRYPVDWRSRIILASLWLVFLCVLWVWGEWISEVMW